MWFTLMLRSGLRVGEVVALRRQDVLSPATPDAPARLRVIGKGRKERIVYLTADAHAVVQRWLAEMPNALDAPPPLACESPRSARRPDLRRASRIRRAALRCASRVEAIEQRAADALGVARDPARRASGHFVRLALDRRLTTQSTSKSPAASHLS